MTEIIVQYVINQRGSAPTGVRITADGIVQRPAPEAPPPGPTARLDYDRPDVAWVQAGHISAEGLAALRTAIRASRFFELPAQLLINYCKDDPSAAIWQVTLDGQTGRVVVFDPRPNRNAQIDGLLAAIHSLLGN